MLSFKNYITGRPTINESAKIVAGLMLRGVDPEKFILDFAEENCPFVYTEVIQSLYLEADPGPTADPTEPGAVPATGGGANPAISKATGQFNQMMGGFKQASDEMGLSGLLSKIGSWFSGGGAAKNFDKAMQALGKVKGVFDTIKVPDQLKEDERFKNYDGFVKELGNAMQSLTKFKDAPAIAGLMDQLKKDPSVFQVNPASAKAVGDSLAEDMPEDPSAEKKADGSGGAASGGGSSTADTMAAHNKPVKNAVVGEEMHKASTGDFSGFPPDKIEDAKEEWEQIKNLPNEDPKKHERWAYIMRYLGHKRQDELRFRKGKLVTESVFSEALVLAGIPTRRRK